MDREEVNERRRKRYCSETRRELYQKKREEILESGKADRARCPMCQLDFRRLYIPRHIVTRHKVPVPADLVCEPC